MSEPLSPREQILRDLHEQEAEDGIIADPSLTAEVEAEAFDEQLREQEESEVEGEFRPQEFESLPFDRAQPEMLTILELERICETLEQVPLGEVAVADDQLQGVAIVLGLGYSAATQMLVLRALQLYREITAPTH